MDNMNESVGKKIVEALKRQAENDLSSSSPVKASSFYTQKRQQDSEQAKDVQTVTEDVSQSSSNTFGDIFADTDNDPIGATVPISQTKTSTILDDSFDSMQGFGDTAPQQFSALNEPAVFEMPSNIVVLKKLISQLPSGVSRHTGAQIIKQTMEALGISMRSVLQDAQQVQENLKNSARECQSYIQEYKKQIVSLEKQSQNYQKQYAALNDLISLFIQANK